MLLTEEIELNGTTVVQTVNKFYRVNLFYVTSAGETKSNEGNINLYADINSTVYSMAYIIPNYSYSQSANWSIPLDEEWYMVGTESNMADESTLGIELQLFL
ncbi:hypothetical protein [Tenacibaculum phage Larrie]|nr:hypothetical protein [Tenacibaculum phage Larrie]